MPPQALLALLMHRGSLPQLLQTVAHEEFVVARREERGGHIDQDCDPAVVVEREDLAAKEDGGDDAAAEITRQVGADGGPTETPYHIPVGETDGVGGGGGRDEGVGGIEGSPDDEADEAVDKELDEEKVAQVRLIFSRYGDECGCWPRVVDQAFARGYRSRFKGLNLLVILPHENEAGNECAKYL